jgi:hypothetical protein
MSESKESELGHALNFLANNWRHNSELRSAFEAIFKTLNNGTNEDRANAEVLNRYLSYPGSDTAIAASVSLNAALRTQAGRRDAGLKARGRGRSYRTEEVRFEDAVMQAMINYELGLASYADVDKQVIAYIGENAVDASRSAFFKELRPRAAAYADFYKRFLTARIDRSSI